MAHAIYGYTKFDIKTGKGVPNSATRCFVATLLVSVGAQKSQLSRSSIGILVLVLVVSPHAYLLAYRIGSMSMACL